VVRTLPVIKVGSRRFAPAGEVSLGQEPPPGPEAASAPGARSATGG
jgi:hypothetical protein